MRIPGLDGLIDDLQTLFGDLEQRGDQIQQSLNDIRDLLIKIEENTRPDENVLLK